ncbi:MAG: glycosyl hydrolase family 43 [Ruminococcaceae bacterium]|nr:glycosyl hydrolase family 43 [Oscillospiraceae bacterium]
MFNLTFEDIKNADFRLYFNNPVLKHPLNSFVVADPSILTPDTSRDKKWHLFCHTFFGVYHYESSDGISFTKVQKIVNRAMRPDINFIDGKYYLYYERTRPVILNALSLFGVKWHSEIYLTESSDLLNWIKPKKVIEHTRSFEKDEKGIAISNPFLLEKDGKYRLYYSCGQTFIKDCGFSEPTHISFAESEKPSEGFVSREKPIISPDKNSKYLNLCSGCLKVYRLKDCYIGLQNGIFEENGKSHSAVMLLRSDDGESFEFVKPLIVPEKKYKWMEQFVYACNLTVYNGKIRIYFNARNTANMLTGRESIGFIEAEI